MAKRIRPEELESAISEIVKEYSDQVVSDVKDAVEAAGKTTAKIAQAYASRIGRGKYAKSIKSKTTESSSFATTVTVHSTQYRIAHLLEHGHIVKVHGKVVGTARAFPHFAPAEKQGGEILEQKVKQAIGG